MATAPDPLVPPAPRLSGNPVGDMGQLQGWMDTTYKQLVQQGGVKASAAAVVQGQTDARKAKAGKLGTANAGGYDATTAGGIAAALADLADKHNAILALLQGDF